MPADLRIDRYDWPGGHEAMLRFGPSTGPVVVAALPLFEEANRTRALLVAMLRALSMRGVASVLPDLPGQGESELPTSQATLAAMRSGFAAAARLAAAGDRPVHGIALRSGALVDGEAALRSRWYLSPVGGRDLLADLARLRRAAGQEGGWEDGAPVEVAGNLISPVLAAELADIEDAGAPRRVVRLDTDPRPADRTLAGAPSWRRSEPTADPVLAQSLADDIARWIASCGA